MKKLLASKQAPLVVIIALLAVGGGSFYGGMLYGKSSVKSASQFNMPGGGAAARMGGTLGGGAARVRVGGGGGFTTGDVVSKTANGFTVKTRDGSSKIVIVASSTTVGKMTEGSMNDVTEGSGVVVAGTSNSDGSITASTVQIRPAGEAMPGFGGPGDGRGSGSGTRMFAPENAPQAQ